MAFNTLDKTSFRFKEVYLYCEDEEKQFAAGCVSNIIYVWQLFNKRLIHRIEDYHTYRCTLLKFSRILTSSDKPPIISLFSADQSGVIYCWALENLLSCADHSLAASSTTSSASSTAQHNSKIVRLHVDALRWQKTPFGDNHRFWIDFIDAGQDRVSVSSGGEAESLLLVSDDARTTVLDHRTGAKISELQEITTVTAASPSSAPQNRISCFSLIKRRSRFHNYRQLCVLGGPGGIWHFNADNFGAAASDDKLRPIWTGLNVNIGRPITAQQQNQTQPFVMNLAFGQSNLDNGSFRTNLLIVQLGVDQICFLMLPPHSVLPMTVVKRVQMCGEFDRFDNYVLLESDTNNEQQQEEAENKEGVSSLSTKESFAFDDTEISRRANLMMADLSRNLYRQLGVEARPKKQRRVYPAIPPRFVE